jgi:hypothetical protein
VFTSVPRFPLPFPHAILGSSLNTFLRHPGKGTQSSLLVEKYNFSHLSAGDLLRAEQERPGSEYGELIQTCIREGTIVPMRVTIKLLENAMRATLESKSGSGWEAGKGRFLIDGFPRKMDQALKFEEDVRVQSLRGFFFIFLNNPFLCAFDAFFFIDDRVVFSGVYVVASAVLHDGRGHDAEAAAETQ